MTIKVKDMLNICDTCLHYYPHCDSRKIVFGKDIDDSLVGREADKVIQCAGYQTVGSYPVRG